MSIIEYFMTKIPTDVIKEILGFIIPNKQNIEFYIYDKKMNGSSSYSRKYETAFIGDKIVENGRGHYLCRIPKQNGRHRYYLTEECIDSIEVEYNDRSIDIFHYDYHSIYVGKDIDMALIELFCLRSIS